MPIPKIEPISFADLAHAFPGIRKSLAEAMTADAAHAQQTVRHVSHHQIGGPFAVKKSTSLWRRVLGWFSTGVLWERVDPEEAWTALLVSDFTDENYQLRWDARFEADFGDYKMWLPGFMFGHPKDYPRQLAEWFLRRLARL